MNYECSTNLFERQVVCIRDFSDSFYDGEAYRSLDSFSSDFYNVIHGERYQERLNDIIIYRINLYDRVSLI